MRSFCASKGGDTGYENCRKGAGKRTSQKRLHLALTDQTLLHYNFFVEIGQSGIRFGGMARHGRVSHFTHDLPSFRLGGPGWSSGGHSPRDGVVTYLRLFQRQPLRDKSSSKSLRAEHCYSRDMI
jgi:hypothetical protein